MTNDFIPERVVGDSNMISMRYTYQYIHNIFADFVKATMDWFVDLYPRFQWPVVGTYDKGVEYINKRIQEGRTPDKPNLPAIILNPTGDFGLDDAASGARQINFRFPNLAPGLISRIYDPIYQDDDIKVSVGFTRLKGDFEFIALLPSFYEYFDLKLLLIQMFAGENRPIYPQWFSSFLVLPSEVYLYTYTNPYTGESHTLDWSKANAWDQLVPTTNRHEWVVPVNMRPRYMLTNMADGSTRYGGDKLADWKLTWTLEYQLELPSMIMVLTDNTVQNIKLEVRHTLDYAPNLQDIIYENRALTKFHWDIVVDTTPESEIQILLPDESEIVDEKDYILSDRIVNIVNLNDSTSDPYIIKLPENEQVEDGDALLLLSTIGYMNYGDHYFLGTDGLTITIRKDTVTLVDKQVIQILIYRSP